MNKQQAFTMIKSVFDQLKLTAPEREQLYKALEIVSAEAKPELKAAPTGPAKK